MDCSLFLCRLHCFFIWENYTVVELVVPLRYANAPALLRHYMFVYSCIVRFRLDLYSSNGNSVKNMIHWQDKSRWNRNRWYSVLFVACFITYAPMFALLCYWCSSCTHHMMYVMSSLQVTSWSLTEDEKICKVTTPNISGIKPNPDCLFLFIL